MLDDPNTGLSKALANAAWSRRTSVDGSARYRSLNDQSSYSFTIFRDNGLISAKTSTVSKLPFSRRGGRFLILADESVAYPYADDGRVTGTQLFRLPQGKTLIRDTLLNSAQFGGFLDGHLLWMDHKTLDVVELVQAGTVRSIAHGESILGLTTVLVEVEREHIKVRLWLSPERSFALLKYEALRSHDPSLLDKDGIVNDWARFSFLATNLQMYATFHIVTDGVLTVQSHSSRGVDYSARWSGRRTVDLKPDFVRDHAFDLTEIPNGAACISDDAEGIPLEWRSGKVVPRRI